MRTDTSPSNAAPAVGRPRRRVHGDTDGAFAVFGATSTLSEETGNDEKVGARVLNGADAPTYQRHSERDDCRG